MMLIGGLLSIVLLGVVGVLYESRRSSDEEEPQHYDWQRDEDLVVMWDAEAYAARRWDELFDTMPQVTVLKRK